MIVRIAVAVAVVVGLVLLWLLSIAQPAFESAGQEYGR